MQLVDGRRTGTREHLITAAIDLFRRQGVSGTGLDEVCRAAGVTKGVFTHHFPGGKSELLTAAVERNGADVRNQLTRVRERTDGSAAAIVEELFATYARLFRRHGWALGCPVAAAVIESQGEDETVTGAAFTSWRGALREGASGLDNGLDALVIAAFEGAILLARAERNADVLDDVGQSLARLLGTPRGEGTTS